MFSPTKQLTNLYPDIQGELCSRHSSLFGKLKVTFNKLYDNMNPTHYILVKGSCQIVQQSLVDLGLSMALQNGMIIMIAKTYPNSQIFMNSNHFGQQIILSPKGELVEGLHPLTDQFQKCTRSANQNLVQDKLNGGIIYVHANVPQDSFHYRQILLIGYYLAILTINQNLVFQKDQIIQKLFSLNIFKSKQFIEKQFNSYKNRQFNLCLPDTENPNLQTQMLIPMDKKLKFLLCKLDLSKQDVKYQISRKRQIQMTKKSVLNTLKNQAGISNFVELFNRLPCIDMESLKFEKLPPAKNHQIQDFMKIQLQEQEDESDILCQPLKFLELITQQINLVSQFSNNKISLQQMIGAIWEINSRYLKIHSPQVIQLVEDMKDRLNVSGCMVINNGQNQDNNFLLVVCPKNKFSQLLHEVKHRMNKGQLKSKSLFKIQDDEVIQQRWNSDKLIGQKMFTTVPSEGVGIFDPSQAIWFFD